MLDTVSAKRNRKRYAKVYPHCRSTWVDDDMAERIDRYRGRVPLAQALRELLEWGLEAAENG